MNEDVLPIENGDFPMSFVSFQRRRFRLQLFFRSPFLHQANLQVLRTGELSTMSYFAILRFAPRKKLGGGFKLPARKSSSRCDKAPVEVSLNGPKFTLWSSEKRFSEAKCLVE